MPTSAIRTSRSACILASKAENHPAFERKAIGLHRAGGIVTLLIAFEIGVSSDARAQSNGNVGGLGEVSVSNPYPFSTLTFIGTDGHIRALNTLDLGSTVLTDTNSVARLSAVAGQTLSFRFGSLGRGSTIYLGSASDTGNILVTGWNGTGGIDVDLVIAGGTVIAGPRNQFGLGDFGYSIRSTTIADGATLQFASDASIISNLNGSGAIGIAAPLTIGGGTFSTSITGPSRLTFTGDSVWTGIGASIGTLEIRPGVTLTTNNAAAVEASTHLQIDGTYKLNSALVVDGLSGNGLIALGLGSRLTVGSQGASSSFSGAMSGSGGGLTKEGSGTLTLSGNSSYTGETIINGGTLRMGTVNALPAASNVRLNGGAWSLSGFSQSVASLSGNPGTSVALGNATLTLGSGSNTGFFGAITGNGGLTKIGSNSQDLYGLNSYSGPTTVAGGLLRLGLGGTLPNSQNITVNAGADFDVVTVNALSPQSRVTLNGGQARLRINGNQNIGALDGTVGSEVLFGIGRSLTIGGSNADSSFAGNLGADGNGSLTKTGSGRLTLTGMSSYTGVTTVDGGTLVVNGSIANSSRLALNAGGTLGGSGTVPSVTVAGGTLSPGSSPGTLTVFGDLTMDAASVYRAEVQGSVADRIDVTGAASLAGTLRLLPLGGAYAFNSPYTLLSAAGGRTGTFGIIDQTGAFGDGVISTVAYTATEVRLTLEPKPLAPIVTPVVPQPGTGSAPTNPRLGVGRPANAFAVATAIDGAVAAGTDPSVLFAIYNLPAAAIPAAVNQLSGEIHTAAPGMANSAADQFMRTMLDRSGTGRLASSWNGPAGAASFTSDLPSRHDEAGRPSLDPARFSLWGATFGSTGRTEGDRGAGSANRNLSDGLVAVGAEIQFGSNTVVGAAVSGGRSRASLSGGLGKAQADIFQAGLYGRTTFAAVNLAAALAYARLDTNTTRAIPALSRTGVTASYATQVWSGRIEASLPVATWNGLTLSPFAAFQAVRAVSPATVERDGAGATAGMLTLARRSDMTSRSELGLQVDAQLMAGESPVTGFVRAAWAHYFQRDAELAASLNGLPGASFTATGTRPDRNAALLAAGADIRLSPSVSLGMRIDTELSPNTRRLGGTAQLRVSF